MMIQLPPLTFLKHLSTKSGQCHVSPDGTELYVSDKNGGITLFTGPDFRDMSDAEISKWIVHQVAPPN